VILSVSNFLDWQCDLLQRSWLDDIEDNAIRICIQAVHFGKPEGSAGSTRPVAKLAGGVSGVVSLDHRYVEQEIQSPTLDTLLRIPAALEVNLDDILAQARN
jgi:hypothetical protein